MIGQAEECKAHFGSFPCSERRWSYYFQRQKDGVRTIYILGCMLLIAMLLGRRKGPKRLSR
jgi:hypothetical protein